MLRQKDVREHLLKGPCKVADAALRHNLMIHFLAGCDQVVSLSYCWQSYVYVQP
jgi:hypothetical protein